MMDTALLYLKCHTYCAHAFPVSIETTMVHRYFVQVQSPESFAASVLSYSDHSSLLACTVVTAAAWVT